VTLVFYEAPHRIVASLADMALVLGADRRVTIARELTKTFETVHTCLLSDAQAWLEADTNQQRGEFVLLVEAPPLKNQEDMPEQTVRMLTLLLAELPLKQAVKLAADISREKKNSLYELALQLKQSQP